MYSIKQEPTGDSDTCLTSCTSEYEMVCIKQENTSVGTADPVEKTEHEVNSNVFLCALFKSCYIILLDCVISTASALCFLFIPDKQNFGSCSCLGGVFMHSCLNFAPVVFGLINI